MKRIGIWIDKEKAHIVTLYNGKESFSTILSHVENFRPFGGSGTRLKGGPQDVVQDSKYLEREKHQLKRYFKNIVAHIKDAGVIVILGPAETGIKFNNELLTNHSDLGKKVKQVIKSDSMTKRQVKALVRSFFKLNGSLSFI